MRRNWWRIPVAILLASSALAFVPTSSAHAQTFTGPPPADGVCVDAVSCVDEAAYLLWSVSDPVFWQTAYVGARELLVQGQEMEDGEYGCSYPAWMTEEAAESGYSSYRQCVSRIESEATFQYFTGLTAEEKEGFCEVVPWYVNCQGETEVPENDYGALIGSYDATYYDRGYDTRSPATGWGFSIPDNPVAFTDPHETTITFWLKNFPNSSGQWGLMHGGSSTNGWAIYSYSGTLYFDWYTGAGLTQKHAIGSSGSCNEGTDFCMYSIVRNSDGLVTVYRGSLNVLSVEVPDLLDDPQYIYGWGSGTGFAGGYSGVPWVFPVRHVTIFPHALTDLQRGALVAFGDDQEALEAGEWDPIFTPEAPVRPGTEELPTPTTELSPSTTTIPPTPATLVPEAPPTGTHEERQTGLLENLVNGVAEGFNWLGGLVGGLLRSVIDMIRWLGDIFGYWIRWLWERLGQLLRSIRSAINSMADLMEWMLSALQNAVVGAINALGSLLSGIWGAVLSIPTMILDGLEWLFIPSAIDVGAIADECATAFPCSWIQEVVDAAGAFGGVIDGSGTCTTPSFDTGQGGVLSLPAPDGCAGGNGAQDGDAGDLFGYRTMLRAVFLVALMAGAMISVLRLTPWGFESPVQPHDLDIG